MTVFSNYFGLKFGQPGLDFVDIPLRADIPVYVDPFAISLYDDDLSSACNDAVVQFFSDAIDAVKSGDDRRAQRMLQRLSEPNETHLGVSAGKPQGRGVGGKQASDLYANIVNSKAAQSGLISELSECDLFVEGIGPDKISDMTTNIIRKFLIEYTQSQCALHNIVLIDKVPSGFLWDQGRGIWREEYVHLPTCDGQKLLLVPKVFVRRSLSLNSQDYLNKHVLEFLQAEHLRAHTALVEVLKNGSRRVTKKSLKNHYSCDKSWLASFSKDNPKVLENYRNVAKSLAKGERKAESDYLNGQLDDALFAEFLLTSLSIISAGNENASNYHNLMKAIIEFLFWPNLINPAKECEIHDGRKRIDLMYTNSAEDGFFRRVLTSPQMAATKLPFECKNYSKDPANPEIDQLSGRFSSNRGWVGFMLYRTTSDYGLLIKRCRDTAQDRRGFIIPLGDDQIIEMIDNVASGSREKVDARLTSIMDRLIY